LIYKYGNMSITDSSISTYGATQPISNTTVTLGSPIATIIRPDHLFSLGNITFTENYSGTYGSSVYIEGDTSQAVTAIAKNFQLDDINISL
jgi:predicted outer membrane repeat protein